MAGAAAEEPAILDTRGPGVWIWQRRYEGVTNEAMSAAVYLMARSLAGEIEIGDSDTFAIGRQYDQSGRWYVNIRRQRPESTDGADGAEGDHHNSRL